jgi:endogenous inhibitor of DNA gyrase (YacG/DUF329 family)
VSGEDRSRASSQPPQPPGTPEKPQPPKACPVCGKPATKEHDPFCSKRCAQIDLNRWLSGTYVIPGKKIEEEDESGD